MHSTGFSIGKKINLLWILGKKTEAISSEICGRFQRRFGADQPQSICPDYLMWNLHQ